VTGRHLQKRVIAVSGELAGLLREQFKPDQVFVIENGVDNECPSSRENHSLHGITRDSQTLNIGIAGRLVPVKRVDIFIQAAQHVKEHHPDIQANFHIFGDGPLKSELESLSFDLGADSYVHFHGHTGNLPEELTKLDMILLTSDHEGLPMVLLESMVCKIPVIAHAVGGIPKLLEHGECGILIDSDVPADYAIAIHKLAQSKDLCTKLTSRAFARIQEKYSAASNAMAYLDHYRASCH
jgi:glycosyltransferase involved in cell wall biosynthesis